MTLSFKLIATETETVGDNPQSVLSCQRLLSKLHNEDDPFIWHQTFAKIDSMLSEKDRDTITLVIRDYRHGVRKLAINVPSADLLRKEHENIIISYIARYINDLIHTYIPTSISVALPEIYQARLLTRINNKYNQINLIENKQTPGHIVEFVPLETLSQIVPQSPAFDTIHSYDPGDGTAIGLDIGGTNTKLVVKKNNEIVSSETIPTFNATGEPAPQFIARLLRTIKRTLDTAKFTPADLSAICISWCGGTDRNRALLLSGALSHYEGTPDEKMINNLAALIKEHFNVPVAILDDTETTGFFLSTRLKPKTYFHIEGTSLMGGYIDENGTHQNYTAIDSRIVVDTSSKARNHSSTGTPGVYQQYCASRGFANILLEVLTAKNIDLNSFGEITNNTAGPIIQKLLDSSNNDEREIAEAVIRMLSEYTARFIALRKRSFPFENVFLGGPFVSGKMGELRIKFVQEILQHRYQLSLNIEVNPEINNSYLTALSSAEYATCLLQKPIRAQNVVVFSRGTASGEKLVEDILESNHNLISIAIPRKAKEFQDFVRAKGIPVLIFPDQDDPLYTQKVNELQTKLHELNADVGMIMQWSHKMPSALFDSFKKGLVNYHPSPLPQYRGASPRQAQILAGEKTTALTWHEVNSAFDAGNIVKQVRDVPIDKNETAYQMFQRILPMATAAAVSYLDEIGKGTDLPVPQIGEPTKFSWRKKKSEQEPLIDIGINNQKQINWRDLSADEIITGVRVFKNFLPEAFTTYEGKRIMIENARKLDIENNSHHDSIPGQIIGISQQGSVTVRTRDGYVELYLSNSHPDNQISADDLQVGKNFESSSALPTLSMNEVNNLYVKAEKVFSEGINDVTNFLLNDLFGLDPDYLRQYKTFQLNNVPINENNKNFITGLFGLDIKLPWGSPKELGKETSATLLTYAGCPISLTLKNDDTGYNRGVWLHKLNSIPLDNPIVDFVLKKAEEIIKKHDLRFIENPFDQLDPLDDSINRLFGLKGFFYSLRLYSPWLDVYYQTFADLMGKTAVGSMKKEQEFLQISNVDIEPLVGAIFDVISHDNNVLVFNGESGLQTVNASRRQLNVDTVCFSALSSAVTKMNCLANECSPGRIYEQKNLSGLGQYEYIIYNGLRPMSQSDYPAGVTVIPDERTTDWNGEILQNLLKTAKSHLGRNGKLLIILSRQSDNYLNKQAIEENYQCRLLKSNSSGITLFELSMQIPDTNEFPLLPANHSSEIIKELSGGSYASTVLVGSENGLIVRKTATGPGYKKLVEEINWIGSLSKESSRYFPQILKHEISPEQAMYEMPYWGKSICRLIIDGELSSELAVSAIEQIVNQMNNSLYNRVSSNEVGDYVDRFHVNKVRERIEETKTKSENLAQLISQPALSINGREYYNISHYLDLIQQNEHIRMLLTPPCMVDVHGDFHFDNILLDPSRLPDQYQDLNFMLIDPRGMKEGNDLAYEMAKLLHSSVGLYDYGHYFDDNIQIKIDSSGKVPDVTFYPLLHDTVTRKYIGIFDQMHKYLEKDSLFKGIGVGDSWRCRVLFQLANVYASLVPFHINKDIGDKRGIFYYLMAIKAYDNALKAANLQ